MTPIGLGDVHGVEAGLIERVEGFGREPLILITISRVRHDVALGQCPNRGAQFVVLVGQAEQIERGIYGGHGSLPFLEGVRGVGGLKHSLPQGGWPRPTTEAKPVVAKCTELGLSRLLVDAGLA